MITYKYRNLPCTIQPDDKLWYVAGKDTKTGASGILEWCYDSEDGLFVMEHMRKAGHFINLVLGKYSDK